jgi:hypothetical protein
LKDEDVSLVPSQNYTCQFTTFAVMIEPSGL